MKDIMIDIETLGTKPYSVILSIGALKFDIKTGEIGEEFHRVIDVKSCKKAGLDLDFDTLVWWTNQPEAVRNSVFKGENRLSSVLFNLDMFICETERIWSNSPSFDLSLIRNAYERIGLEPAWNYLQERDVRTISALRPEIRETCFREGIAHNAIDDCKFQVKYLVKTLSELKINY